MDNNSIISINNIVKKFGGILALNKVSFDIRRGEILGLLGANGAGKSTLLKVIGSVEKPDEGHIWLEGAPLKAETPHAAQKQGLISVYQELNVFLHMTVAENLFLGREPRNKSGLIDHKRMNNEAGRILEAFKLDVSPNTLLQNTSVAKRHIVEIVRAMNEAPKILMLDEPTASLSRNQIQWLFEKIRELVANGTTVVYVSHRLDEILELCDRCVVLKDGSVSAVLDDSFDKDQIIQAMIGRKIESGAKKSIDQDIRDNKDNQDNKGKAVFSCKDLSVKDTLYNISFDIAGGEILGIGGLVGAGRSELLKALYGIEPIDSGTISIHQKEIKNKHPADAIKNKMVLISEDRKLEGLFLSRLVMHNISANTIDKWSKFGFVRSKSEFVAAKDAGGDVSLDTNRMLETADTLSGGNQQKVVLAKALLTEADILLLDEPTRGVDVGARDDIYETIGDLAKKGKSILLVSSDWEELIALSDRLIVMAEGKITAELKGDDLNEENLTRYSTLANVESKKTQAGKNSLMAGAQDLLLHSNNNTVFLGIFLAILVVIGSIISPKFLSNMNIINILNQSFLYIFFTLGQIFVVIQGYVDLSMSSTMTVAGLIGLSIMAGGENMIIAGILAMIAFGLIIGLCNATIVVLGKMNSMIATYGTGIILQGLALIITPRAIGPAPDIFKDTFRATLFGLPVTLYIALIFIAGFFILLKYTSLGRQIFAVGENPLAALWSGLKVKSTKYFTFLTCSIMAIAGTLFMLGRSGAADPTVDIQINLDVLAFALIGGGSFSGGKGSVGGSVLSVFCVVILMNILNVMNVGTYQKIVIKGILLISIIVLNEYRSNRSLSSG